MSETVRGVTVNAKAIDAGIPSRIRIFYQLILSFILDYML